MIKVINLEISTCFKCPYCIYDSNLPDRVDSGYVCINKDCDQRIIISNYEILNSLDMLDVDHNVLIPAWCPLKDKPAKPSIATPNWLSDSLIEKCLVMKNNGKYLQAIKKLLDNSKEENGFNSPYGLKWCKEFLDSRSI